MTCIKVNGVMFYLIKSYYLIDKLNFTSQFLTFVFEIFLLTGSTSYNRFEKFSASPYQLS